MPRQFFRLFVWTILFGMGSGSVIAQDIDITFRYIPQPGETVTAAFVRGDFNGWSANASTEMTFVDSLQQWVFTETFAAGETRQYKIFVHRNASGSQNEWITDPLNPISNPADNNNSVLTVGDPMVFQLGRRENADGEIVDVSAGIFGSETITALTFEVNGVEQDGLPFYDAETNVFRHVLPAPIAGGSQFKVTATDAASGTASAEVGIIAPTVEDAARPAGIRDGVNYAENDPTTVTLSLFAPGKNFVHVLGDFNGWQIDDAYLMKRDVAGEDSVHWWLEIDGLNATQEYAYQYLVDGELRLADMYAEKILDPGNDPFISGTTYPNLKPYPTGQTQGVVAVLQPGQDPYPWVIDDFERPPQGELVIYELLLRDFVAAHDYTTLVDTLDYLDRLGVNAIELMPISEFGGNLNWGYQPQFYFAPDKYYGPADDLKRFIDEAHQRDIAVILDVVYNHVDFPSPLIQLFGATDSNPWINVPAHHPINVFFDLNHENSYTQYWLDRVNAYWLTEFKVDGFRFDLSKGITQRDTGSDVGAWSSYDASRIALLTRMADQIWAVDPEAYVILEHFGSDQEERELATHGMDAGRPGMMLWNNANHAYNEATMGYHGGGQSDFSHAYYGPGGKNWPVPHTVSYMESHDEQWLMFKNRSFGACVNAPFGGNRCNTDPGAYNTRALPTALDRMKMAGTFFFLLPGPRMMWQFGELGYGFGNNGEECLKPGGGNNGDCSASAPGRTGEKPIRWDYRTDPAREKLYKAWAALINLRQEHPVFRSTETAVTLDLRNAVKQIQLSHPTMNVTILGNFDVMTREATATFSQTGTWYDFFSGDMVEVTATSTPFTLPAGAFHIFTDVAVSTPEPGLITVGIEEDIEVPTAFSLDQNYPNPFNPATAIRFAVPEAGAVRLDVFDVLGRQVAVLVDSTLPAGTHTATFEAGTLPSGLYLYRLQAGTRTETKTMMLVR